MSAVFCVRFQPFKYTSSRFESDVSLHTLSHGMIYEIELFHWLQCFVFLLNPTSVQVAGMILMYHLTPSHGIIYEIEIFHWLQCFVFCVYVYIVLKNKIIFKCFSFLATKAIPAVLLNTPMRTKYWCFPLTDVFSPLITWQETRDKINISDKL